MHFHIDYLSPDAERPQVLHLMQGHLPEGVPVSDLMAHPHARSALPAKPCMWMRGQATSIVVLSPRSILEVAERSGNAFLLAVARCAQAISGFVVLGTHPPGGP